MPTTPNGTAYTVTSASVSGAGTVYIGVADAVAGDPDLPVVLYGHGAAGAANQFATLGAWSGLRNWLIDNGWAWVEGTGGGSQPWGNPASETAYGLTIDHADTVLDIGFIVGLGRSMSGTVIARLYNARRGTDPRWVGLIVNSGVQDLVWAYDWDSGRWTSAFNAAWGVASKAAFEAAVAGLNPVDGPASSWAGSNVLQLWGDADDTVPAGPNGQAMRTLYAGQPTVDLVDIRPGGDHSATNGSYLEVDAMTAFLEQVTGTTPTPPDPGMYLDVVELYVRGGGFLYPIALV